MPQIGSDTGVPGELESHAASDAVANVIIGQVGQDTTSVLLGALPNEAESKNSVRTYPANRNGYENARYERDDFPMCNSVRGFEKIPRFRVLQLRPDAVGATPTNREGPRAFLRRGVATEHVADRRRKQLPAGQPRAWCRSPVPLMPIVWFAKIISSVIDGGL